MRPLILLLVFLFLSPAPVNAVASFSNSLFQKRHILSRSSNECRNSKLKRKKRREIKRSIKRDWVDRGGFGRLAVGCLALIAILLLWFNPSGWLVLGLFIGSFVFAVIGLLVGGENAGNSKGVLGVLGVLGIVFGLTLWMISRRPD